MLSGHTHLLSLAQFQGETCMTPERKQRSALSNLLGLNERKA